LGPEAEEPGTAEEEESNEDYPGDLVVTNGQSREKSVPSYYGSDGNLTDQLGTLPSMISQEKSKTLKNTKSFLKLVSEYRCSTF